MFKSAIKKLEKKLGRSRRKTVPRIERISSVVILLLVVGVGVAVAVKGRIYDPGRYELNEASLAGTAGEVTGYTRPVETEAITSGEAKDIMSPEGYGAEINYESNISVPSDGAEREPLAINVAGTMPYGETEFYNPDTLYEKIDGRAEAYLEFGFKQLRCRTFDLTESQTGAFVDVYVYQMGEPINAYGIFALERDPKGEKLDFGEDGYRSGMGLFFRQGSVYLQVLASEEIDATLAKAREIAQAMIARIPADSDGLDGRLALPAANQVPGSIKFEQANAQGLDFLSNVFSADYTVEGKTLRYFIAVQPDETVAREVYEKFQEFCKQFGTVESIEVGGAQMFKSEMFGTWKIVCQRGAEVSGVIDTENPDEAVQFVTSLLAKE